MSSYLVEAGTSLYKLSVDGATATQLVLPTIPVTVTLYGEGTPIRSAVYVAGNSSIIVCVNGGTQDFYIDTNNVLRTLQLSPPTGMATAAAGSGTGLTGVYKVAVTFKIKDSNGATIIESGLGPVSVPTSALANKTILLTNIPVSSDGTVNARGLYRTLAGGNVFYPWFDIDDNVTLTEERGASDASLSVLGTNADRNNPPPDLSLIAVWLNRIWGVPRIQKDNVRWTDDGVFYAWSADNEIVAPPVNQDPYGVTALIPRRDSLGIAKRRRLYMMTGTGNDSFQRVGISETLGCVSQESVVLIENVAYMLGERSVNEWSDEGVRSISSEQVDAWFNTDQYFNRALFSLAQGRYNPDTDAYELLMASAGSTELDAWVSYHLRSRTWYGPHKVITGAFEPTCTGTGTSVRGTITDSDDLPITVFGADDGYIYKRDTDTLTDGPNNPVEFSVDLPFLSANEPDLLKFFDRPTIHTRVEAQGTVTVTPIVGGLDATASDDLTHDLTLGREVLERLGTGNYCQLNLSHSSVFERPRIFGIEIPYVFIGRR